MFSFIRRLPFQFAQDQFAQNLKLRSPLSSEEKLIAICFHSVEWPYFF